MKKITKYQKGQTMIMLLFFVLVGIAVAATIIAMVINNSLAVTNVEMGETVRQMADTGIEKALLQIVRQDGAYSSETLTNTDIPEWDSGWKVDITVTGTSHLKIDSTASAGKFVKKVEVDATYVDNELTINTWKEVN